MRIPGITARRFRSRWLEAQRAPRRFKPADLVCLIGWHYWGKWDKPTVAVGRVFQQRVCEHCGRAQVREG